MRIQQLPIALANQIAAGEVIERPASIVKELLENALDAKATVINIDISYGGLNQVKISDNGIGIVADDLPLAIAPNATSKISQLSDLYSIASMGFRGEALASIASVSRLIISSKPSEQAHAMRLVSDGQTINIEPCARTQGTTVDVRDIFFNAPVRKKFLKTERIEFQAIEMVVKRFALSAQEITINLNHNDKKILHLPAAFCDKTRLLRIRKILGKAFVEQSTYVDIEHSTMRLYGWVGNEDNQRSQNDKQWIYINGRMVKDKLLNHAIKQGYESVLYPGRYPSCLLYLVIPPEEVDVNVHPTKHEVRFQQPRLIHDFISLQIQRTLQVERQPQQYQLIDEQPAENMQINETYITTSPFTHDKEDVLKEQSWIYLNEQFILIFLHDKPYIVDVLYIQQHWLKSCLTQQQLPLASRPLLVPISHTLNAIELERFEVLKPCLEQVGIDVNLIGNNVIYIRSLPIAIPHLDLKQFLNAIFNVSSLTNMDVMELLIKHQIFNPKTVTQEEREVLIAYIHTLNDGMNEQQAWRKQLSAEFCWDVVNG